MPPLHSWVMPLRYATPRNLSSQPALSWPDTNQGSISAITLSSAGVLCWTRSTVAIRSSIRVPVNIFCISRLSFRTRPCFIFRGRSGDTPPQNLYPARLTITAPGSLAVSPDKPKLFAASNSCRQDAGATLASCRCYILSAARIFALRDRGLRSISSSDAVSGFFVSTLKYLSFPPRNASFTILSSSE